MAAVASSDQSIHTSRIEGMRALSPAQRRQQLAAKAHLNDEQVQALSGENALAIDLADGMIENTFGKFELPMGVATNFIINGKEYLIPMAVEEPSVVASASYMAKIARDYGGFEASSSQPIMRAQIQILQLKDPFGARLRLLNKASDIIALANSKDKVLINLGGGCKDMDVQVFETSPVGPMVVVHLLVDVRDAMGANTVNTMAELVAPQIEAISGGAVRLRILSNLADKRLVRGRVQLPYAALATQELAGEEVAQGIVEACALALIDPYRAATHNKGIMNGIDPVVIATGNDWRAIEAGAHAFAAQSGQYQALTRWELDGKGHLTGSIEMPMALGIVGGATKTHPTAQAALALMKIQSAQELAEVSVVVGLAQNMAALRALATEGIQKGHMKLHARNIAIAAGASASTIDQLAAHLVKGGDISVDAAQALLKKGNL